jgi:L-rhamnose mutarotase
MSTIHVRQYRPAFFSGFETDEADVETVAELLAIPFIKRWVDREANPNLTRLSISSHPYIGAYNLMAEIDNNREWWVVAILTSDEPDHPILKEMPEWTMTE